MAQSIAPQRLEQMLSDTGKEFCFSKKEFDDSKKEFGVTRKELVV